MNFFATNNQNENIETAQALLLSLGISDVSFAGYSDSNGVSVYFTNSKGVKCRVSNHSTMNRDRMNEELQVSFDQKCLGLGGKYSIKSSLEINKLMVKIFGY